MDLHPAGRDLYTLELALKDFAGATVAVDAAEASFDGGETWPDGAEDGTTHFFGWWVEGADADPPGGGVSIAATITAATLQPQVKLHSGDAIIVVDGPTISLKT